MLLSPDSPVGNTFAEIQTQIDKQAQTTLQQRRCLEEFVRSERETKLVVLGATEEGKILQNAAAEGDKLQQK